MKVKKILETTLENYVAPVSVTDVVTTSGVINIRVEGGGGAEKVDLEVFSRLPHNKSVVAGNYLDSKNTLLYTQNWQEVLPPFSPEVLQLGPDMGTIEKTDASGPLDSNWSYLMNVNSPLAAYVSTRSQNFNTADATVQFHADNTIATSIYVKSLWNHNQLPYSDDLEKDPGISFNPETADYFGTAWNVTAGAANSTAKTIKDKITPWGTPYLEILTKPNVPQSALGSSAFMIINSRSHDTTIGQQPLEPWDENMRTTMSYYIKQPDLQSERLITWQSQTYDARIPQAGGHTAFYWGDNVAPSILYQAANVTTTITDAGDGWYRITASRDGLINSNNKNGDPMALYWYLGNSNQLNGYTNLANDPQLINKRVQIGGFQLETHPITTATTATTYVGNAGYHVNHHRNNQIGYTNALNDASEWYIGNGGVWDTSTIGTKMGNGQTGFIVSGPPAAAGRVYFRDNNRTTNFRGEEKHILSIYTKQTEVEADAGTVGALNLYDMDAAISHQLLWTFPTYGGAPTLTQFGLDGSGFEDAGDGWYRMWGEIDGLPAGTVEGNRLQPWFYLGETATASTYQDKNMFVYGPQLETVLSGTPSLDPPRSYQEIRTDDYFGSSGLPHFRCSESMMSYVNNITTSLDGRNFNLFCEASGSHWETGSIYDGTSEGRIATVSSVGDGWYHVNCSVSGIDGANTNEGDWVGTGYYPVYRFRDPHATKLLFYGPQLGLTDSITNFYLGDYKPVFTTDTNNFDKLTSEYTANMGRSSNSSGPIRLSPEMYIRVVDNTITGTPTIKAWIGHK